MMSVYPIVRIQLSFVQFSLLCYKFCILSKAECKSIYYHFRHDPESSSFRKLARSKWICRETWDFFFCDQFTLKKLSLFFISNQVPFNRQDYQKQKGPGTSDQSLFRS